MHTLQELNGRLKSAQEECATMREEVATMQERIASLEAELEQANVCKI
jgi:chromosome segregation ATPase